MTVTNTTATTATKPATKAVAKPKISCFEMLMKTLKDGTDYTVPTVTTLMLPKGFKSANISNAFYRLRDTGHLVKSTSGNSWTFHLTAVKKAAAKTIKAKTSTKKAAPKKPITKKAAPKKSATSIKKLVPKGPRPGSISAQAAKQKAAQNVLNSMGVQLQVLGQNVTVGQAAALHKQLNELFGS